MGKIFDDVTRILGEVASNVIQLGCTAIGSTISGAITTALAIPTVGGGAIAAPLIVGGYSMIGSGVGIAAGDFVKDLINSK